MSPSNYETLPEGLPAPVDDGACRHLPGMRVPALALPSTAGRPVVLAALAHVAAPHSTPARCVGAGTDPVPARPRRTSPGPRGRRFSDVDARRAHRLASALDPGRAVSDLPLRDPALAARAPYRRRRPADHRLRDPLGAGPVVERRGPLVRLQHLDGQLRQLGAQPAVVDRVRAAGVDDLGSLPQPKSAGIADPGYN